MLHLCPLTELKAWGGLTSQKPNMSMENRETWFFIKSKNQYFFEKFDLMYFP